MRSTRHPTSRTTEFGNARDAALMLAKFFGITVVLIRPPVGRDLHNAKTGTHPAFPQERVEDRHCLP
jgi:hypothetical protein